MTIKVDPKFGESNSEHKNETEQWKLANSNI